MLFLEIMGAAVPSIQIARCPPVLIMVLLFIFGEVLMMEIVWLS
jgi:hypothetical protein